MPRSKSVSFGVITILEFPIVLGENPAVSGGAPIELGWTLVKVYTRELQLYEYLRSDLRSRGRKNLTIPVADRTQLLLDSGYSLEDIGAAAVRAEDVQRQRSASLKLADTTGDRMLSLLETTGKIPSFMVRGVLKLSGGGRKHPKQNAARSA
jgi:hypothetical protein